ncbi:MAG: glycosyltransferase family 39 protein [Thermodesulfovibrionales bacterium]|nr:glycosyltransferase family 39 protein [Thermodesulfovibrionales bacterium]
MMNRGSHGSSNGSLKDLLLISLITFFVYLPLLGTDVFDGNEPIRVIIAKEMLKTGNWTLPLLHGQLYFIKPPLMSWLIAASGSIFGVVNEWTARFPSVIAVLLTGYTVYFLTIRWLTREGRLFASLALLTMVSLITKGMTAEIDSLFVLLTSSALLTWFYGYTQQWKPVFVWLVPLSITGIGFLTKGPQGTAYFYFTVFAYLLYRRNLRFFFSLSHLAGFLCFLSILGIYLLTVLQHVSLDEYFQMWKGQTVQRASSNHSFGFLKHLVSYPVESFLSFLPWTFGFLPLMFMKELRMRAKDLLSNDLFLFSFIMIAVNFPLYWLLPGARVRYILPFGPFVAIMLALLFVWYKNEADNNPRINIFFNKFFHIFLWMVSFCAVSIIPVAIFLKTVFSLHLILLMSALILFVLFLWLKRNALSAGSIPVVIALLTGFFMLIYSGIQVQLHEKRPDDPGKIAREINTVLPKDTGRVYEIGYDRFLEITCYLNRDVIQLDSFDQLKPIEKQKDVYFIFDTAYFRKAQHSAGIDPGEDLRWDKVYSAPYKNEKTEIVVGHLRANDDAE